MVLAIALLLLGTAALDSAFRLLELPFPGCVAGYIILLTWLIYSKNIPEELAQVSDQFVRLIPVFLVPPAVGVLDNAAVHLSDILPLAAGVAIGTVAGIFVTAATMMLVVRVKARSGRSVNAVLDGLALRKRGL